MLDIKLKLKSGHTTTRDWMSPAPIRTLLWNVTYACNYRCGICFTDAGEPHPDELTTDEAKLMLDRARGAGVQDFIISGGEPFVREDMIELLTHAGDLGIGARIATNGSLLTNEMLARLRDNTLTQSFQVSLDTLDPSLYENFHGSQANSLHIALDTVRRIQEHGFHTTVSVRLTPETLPGIHEILDMACAEGWSTVTMHLPVHTRRAKGAFPPGTDILALLEPVFEQFLALPNRWLIETYIPWAEHHTVIQRLREHIQFVFCGCRAGRDRLTISPSGWLSPCICLDVPEAYIGNVKHDDFRDIFQESELCKMMRRPSDHGICEDCEHVRTCGGGCRATAFAMTGRLDGQDESCPLLRQNVTERSHAHDSS